MSHRFFVNPSVISGDQFLIKDQGIVHQISRVLRMKSGETMILLDNLGNEFIARITLIDKRSVEGDVVARETKSEPMKRDITLYQSLLKKNNFELVLQKCTELGVSEFFPIITSRTVKIKRESSERWENIVREAAEQSGRVFIPKLNKPTSFSVAVQQAASVSGQKNLIPHPLLNPPPPAEGEEAKPRTDPQRLYGGGGARWYNTGVEKVGIFIGPEGGFSESEVAIATNHGIIPVSLGALVLRAETAAIAATTIAMLV